MHLPHVGGGLGGRQLRAAQPQTKSWERAVVLARKIEEAAEVEPASRDEAVTIARAVQEYLADAKARELGLEGELGATVGGVKERSLLGDLDLCRYGADREPHRHVAGLGGAKGEGRIGR